MRRDRPLSKSEELLQEVQALSAERSALFDDWLNCRRKYHELRLQLIHTPDNRELAAEAAASERQCDTMDARIQELWTMIDARLTELRSEDKAYRRPNGWWSGFISRWLGPLPEGFEDLEYDRAEFQQAPSRWWLAGLMVTLVLGSVVALTTLFPTTGISPANAVLGQDLTTWLIVGLATGLLVAGVVAQARGQFSIVAFISDLALEEELWFRLGAEKWSGRQRFASCVAFGLAHLLNLIYAMATLGMLVVVGAVLMLVYLHELRRTGDQRQAVVASAKLHANYNLIALGVLVVSIAIWWITTVATAFHLL